MFAIVIIHLKVGAQKKTIVGFLSKIEKLTGERSSWVEEQRSDVSRPRHAHNSVLDDWHDS